MVCVGLNGIYCAAGAGGVGPSAAAVATHSNAPTVETALANGRRHRAPVAGVGVTDDVEGWLLGGHNPVPVMVSMVVHPPTLDNALRTLTGATTR